jgi:hypothetical protein
MVRIRYDNLSSAVSRVLFGRARAESDRRVLFRSTMAFEAFYCIPGIAGAHEKGGVEGEVGRFQRSHLVPVPEMPDWPSLDDRIERIDAAGRNEHDAGGGQVEHLACPSDLRRSVGEGEAGLQRPTNAFAGVGGDPVSERGEGVQIVERLGELVDEHGASCWSAHMLHPSKEKSLEPRRRSAPRVPTASPWALTTAAQKRLVGHREHAGLAGLRQRGRAGHRPGLTQLHLEVVVEDQHV